MDRESYHAAGGRSIATVRHASDPIHRMSRGQENCRTGCRNPNPRKWPRHSHVRATIPKVLRFQRLCALGLVFASSLGAEPSPPLLERLPGAAPPVASPGYEIVEEYCVDDHTEEPFTVFVARVEGPGKFDKTFRFPISREVYRLRDDTGAPIPLPMCAHALSGTIGDNLNGTGMRFGVNVTAADKKGVHLNVSMSWDGLGNDQGRIESNLFFPWQTSARLRLSDQVSLAGWFRAPQPTSPESTKVAAPP